MIVINEIFHSIQGESSWVGYPTTFVRTSGCHLRCDYCDTTYAYHQGEKMSLDQIMTLVAKNSANRVCITGGEPLLQKDVYSLMTQLCDAKYLVSLETSGDISCENVDPRVKLIIDVKTPDSGEKDKFDKRNLQFANKNNEYKFVICSESDFTWCEEFAETEGLFANSNVLYSPSFGKVKEAWLAEQILTRGSKARLQLQMHKYIWPADTRGV